MNIPEGKRLTVLRRSSRREFGNSIRTWWNKLRNSIYRAIPAMATWFERLIYSASVGFKALGDALPTLMSLLLKLGLLGIFFAYLVDFSRELCSIGGWGKVLMYIVGLIGLLCLIAMIAVSVSASSKDWTSGKPRLPVKPQRPLGKLQRSLRKLWPPPTEPRKPKPKRKLRTPTEPQLRPRLPRTPCRRCRRCRRCPPAAFGRLWAWHFYRSRSSLLCITGSDTASHPVC